MPQKLPLPVVVVLAAGASRRFQAEGGVGSKLSAALVGRPVLEWTLDAVQASGLPWVLVERPKKEAERLGMGDSIARGVARTSEASGWLILPGDMPLLQSSSVVMVAQTLQTFATNRPETVVRPELKVDGEKRPGHPVGFGPAWKGALLRLRGDTGAIALVRWAIQQGSLRSLPCDDIGCVYDVDRPIDLTHAERHIRNGENSAHRHGPESAHAAATINVP